MKYCIIILSFFSCYSASSQPGKDTAKNSYHLFSTTPRHQMRRFETDRPDATESPITLDAGHLQYETHLFKSEKIKTMEVKDRETQKKISLNFEPTQVIVDPDVDLLFGLE